MSTKRKLFIGCSLEAIDLANYIKTKLQAKVSNVDIVIWSDKANWENGTSTLDNLLDVVDEFYYSIFIFHPDDFIKIRLDNYWITRDNVIFEAGLFYSKLGKTRTFILKPSELTNHPVNNLFRVPSDLNGIEFTNYKINYDITTNKWEIDKENTFTETNIEKIFSDINSKETALNISQASSENEVGRITDTLIGELQTRNKNFEQYLNIFSKHFADLVWFKSIQIGKPIENILTDISISINKINDVLDISQLADEQSIVNNPNLDVVWVFSDYPLEFKPISSGDKLKPHFDKLKETILANLKAGVKYAYFVGKNFDLRNLNSLVGPSTSLLSNIEIIMCDKKHFLTFFTLHFNKNEQNPSEIYVSFVDKNRDDLLIKVPNSNQITDIHDNLKTIKGKSEITATYNVFDRTN